MTTCAEGKGDILSQKAADGISFYFFPGPLLGMVGVPDVSIMTGGAHDVSSD
jgi:hypothetical protein